MSTPQLRKLKSTILVTLEPKGSLCSSLPCIQSICCLYWLHWNGWRGALPAVQADVPYSRLLVHTGTMKISHGFSWHCPSLTWLAAEGFQIQGCGLLQVFLNRGTPLYSSLDFPLVTSASRTYPRFNSNCDFII